MTFSIEWTHQAVRSLEKLPREVSQRIEEKLELLSEDPFLKAKKLSGRPEWSLRVGDYRVLIDVAVEGKKITVLTIDHRKNVYKW